ncbi:MAG: hypothetical protein RBT81_07965 [Gammaproteobacteria bacterium]|jgi:hypothetical protein|nr:hypothetical protein [Gammaproteobacteria bacterium]
MMKDEREKRMRACGALIAEASHLHLSSSIVPLFAFRAAISP